MSVTTSMTRDVTLSHQTVTRNLTPFLSTFPHHPRLDHPQPCPSFEMGNDGGSIPDRRDLVRNKPKAEQADKANQTRARWFFCALSKVCVHPSRKHDATGADMPPVLTRNVFVRKQRPLQEPIVSCDLGKLYNKDALIEFLLDRSAFGDGEEICGHIRSLKVRGALFRRWHIVGINSCRRRTSRRSHLHPILHQSLTHSTHPLTGGCSYARSTLRR